MTELNLPPSIEQLSVQYNQGEHTTELGILTHGAYHSFQYTQHTLPISLMMKCRNDT